MSKQVLIEQKSFSTPSFTLTEGKTSKRGNPLVEGILATAEIKNGNGRYYKRSLWEREIEKYMVSVKSNRALGELDHPESSIINLKNVSHNITDLWWDFVTTPSNPDSWMSPLREGIDYSNVVNPYQTSQNIITDILCSQGSCPIF